MGCKSHVCTWIVKLIFCVKVWFTKCFVWKRELSLFCMKLWLNCHCSVWSLICHCPVWKCDLSLLCMKVWIVIVLYGTVIELSLFCMKWDWLLFFCSVWNWLVCHCFVWSVICHCSVWKCDLSLFCMKDWFVIVLYENVICHCSLLASVKGYYHQLKCWGCSKKLLYLVCRDYLQPW